MTRVLVTGGSGFIGTNLVGYLVKQGISVLNIDLRAPRHSEQSSFWRRVDLLDARGLREAVQGFAPTHLIHLAARTDLAEAAGLEGYAANTRGVENLLDALAETLSVQRVIFTSSMLVNEVGYRPRHEQDYGPTTLYGESKVIGERLVRSARLGHYRWTIVRPTSIWGPWFGEPYRSFFELVASNHYFLLPAGKAATKTFGYVVNTVHQLARLLVADPSRVHGRTFYLGDNPPLNVALWAQAIADEFGARRPKHLPMAVFRGLAGVGDLLAWARIPFPMTSFRLRNMTTDNVVDLSATEGVVGCGPIELAEGIRETVLWLARRP